MMPVKADLVICSSVIVYLDRTRVWLSCQAIIWISVLAGLFRVFSNPVTCMYVYEMAIVGIKVAWLNVKT